MKARPIKVLVEALRALGADIEYLEKTGFPPLKIKGKKLRVDDYLSVDGEISSQYISALLMIGPMLENGLKLRLNGDIVSRPYINLTIALMKGFGADVNWVVNRPVIEVKPGGYHSDKQKFTIEPDWSAAAFWLEIIALRKRKDHDSIRLSRLNPFSYQGDSCAARLFSAFDVNMVASGKKAHDAETNSMPYSMVEDLNDCPDLAQALIVTACLTDTPFIFNGLETLHIKETDRVSAMVKEMAKLGYALYNPEDEPGTLMWQRGTVRRKTKTPVIETYKDHRMAMAFAPACIKTGEIRIADPDVVSKSYPGFWDDLRMAGFTIEEEAEA